MGDENENVIPGEEIATDEVVETPGVDVVDAEDESEEDEVED